MAKKAVGEIYRDGRGERGGASSRINKTNNEWEKSKMLIPGESMKTLVCTAMFKIWNNTRRYTNVEMPTIFPSKVTLQKKVGGGKRAP